MYRLAHVVEVKVRKWCLVHWNILGQATYTSSELSLIRVKQLSPVVNFVLRRRSLVLLTGHAHSSAVNAHMGALVSLYVILVRNHRIKHCDLSGTSNSAPSKSVPR
jgi:hypothetical protein